MKDRSNRR